MERKVILAHQMRNLAVPSLSQVILLRWTGIDDAVIIPESPVNDFQDGDDFSIDVWVKTSSTNQGLLIAGKHLAGSFNGYYLFMSGADPNYCNILGHVGFYVASSAGGDACSDTPINDGEWHHVVGAYDDASNQAKLYIDGVLQSDVGSKFGTLDNAEDFTIGLPSFSLYYEGEIDELKLWDYERSEIQIQTDQNTTLVGNEAGLAAYYRFDQDEATDLILPDRSVNNNNGTWNGNGSGVTTPQWTGSGVQIGTPADPSDLFTTEISASQIDLSWADNSPNETGFTIERSDGNNSTWVTLNSVPADQTTYSDNSVTADNGYFYRVIANGETDSAPSNEKFGSTITPPGNAITFDGVDDHITIPDNSDVDFGSGDFTIELWFKPNTLADGNRMLVGKDLPGQRQFGLQYDRNFTGNNKNLSIIFYRDDDSFSGLDSDAGAISDTDWHHIAAVRRLDNFEIYVDGLLIKSGVNILGSVGGAMATSSSPILLGASNGGGSNVDGQMDEIRIWSEARTQDEIRHNASRTLVGNETNLVSYYRFDQDEATDLIVPDRSTNNNNGTWTDAGGGVTTPQWVPSLSA